MIFLQFLTVFLPLIFTKIVVLDLNMYLQYLFMQFGAGSMLLVQLWYLILSFLQKIAQKMIFLLILAKNGPKNVQCCVISEHVVILYIIKLFKTKNQKSRDMYFQNGSLMTLGSKTKFLAIFAKFLSKKEKF